MAIKTIKTIESPVPGKKGKGCLKGCLALFVILIVFFGGVEIFRRYTVNRFEENFLTTYKPTPEIADIANKIVLTDKAKKIFYRADPEFIAGDVFADYCLVRSGIELALACARSNTPGEKTSSGPRIYLLRIDNPEFESSKYPSAAHEILHLVYQAMPAAEKKRIGLLIDQEVAKRRSDQHIEAIVEILKKSVTNYQEEIQNEMHSVFGAEYTELSGELEEYYAQYFYNRQQVVGLYENGGLEKRIRNLDILSHETKALDNQLISISGQLSAFEKSGDRQSYNSLVPQFNSLVGQYNAKVNEGQAIYNEISSLYKLINPNFQLPQEKS